MNSISNNKLGQLRVCSYNIHKGFSTGNLRFLLQHIRDAVHLCHADIVFLQEVIGEHQGHASRVQDWIPESQFEYLADTLWQHHAYGKNAVYDHGHHGNAILSRFPLLSQHNYDISLFARSSRGVLHTRSENGLQLFCVHLGLLATERKIQLKKLIALIKSCTSDTDVIIIAGDFNDWSNTLGAKLKTALALEDAVLMVTGKPQATFPAFAPMLAVDRIYYRGLQLLDAKVLSGRPWSRLSDHCAVIADFNWPNQLFNHQSSANSMRTQSTAITRP